MDRKTLLKTVITPNKGIHALGLNEMWEYRELLYIFTWREVKVRYKQTILGMLWALLQPLLAMIVFTLIFSRLAKIPSDGIPYPLFAYCGLLPWQIFIRALTEASTCLVANEKLVTKIYFPRFLVPAAVVLASLVDFAVASVLLLPLTLYYGFSLSANLIIVPAIMLILLLAGMGVSFWLSAFDVQYRDVRYTFPFMTQLWLFATPIVYPSSLIPEAWRTLYALNPMVGVVEGFRWACIGGGGFSLQLLLISSMSAIFLFCSGLFYFKQIQDNFADII